MPFGDKTGPRGSGPLTGRGAGYCAGYPVPRAMNLPFGRGPGLGRAGYWGRGGRGHRNWYYATGLPGWARFDAPAWGTLPAYAAPMAQDQEAVLLEQQAAWLRQQLGALEERIAALGREPGAAKESQDE